MGALFTGCASGGSITRIRVALLPFDAVGATAERHAPALRRSLQRAMQRRSSVSLVSARQVDGQHDKLSACSGNSRSTSRCAAAVGRAVGATRVLLGAVGGLDRSFLIQVKVVDVARAVVTRSLDEAHFGGGAALASAADKLVDRIFPATRSVAWYQRWWLWTAVGVAATTAAVVVPLTVIKEDDPYEPISLP